MQHRDKIIIQKVISEIDIGLEILGNITLEAFCILYCKKGFSYFENAITGISIKNWS